MPADPQREVTVGLSDHDYVLALGVVPVGLTDWYGDQPNGVWPWAADRLGGAQPVVLPRNGAAFLGSDGRDDGWVTFHMEVKSIGIWEPTVSVSCSSMSSASGVVVETGGSSATIKNPGAA